MRCHRSYPIADFENFSPGTLKMANNLRPTIQQSVSWGLVSTSTIASLPKGNTSP